MILQYAVLYIIANFSERNQIFLRLILVVYTAINQGASFACNYNATIVVTAHFQMNKY